PRVLRSPLFSAFALSWSVPRAPPTSSLFPYTTLFRSLSSAFSGAIFGELAAVHQNKLKGQEDESVLIDGLDCLVPPLDEAADFRSEEHTSELQSRENLVCRLLLEKKKEPH